MKNKIKIGSFLGVLLVAGCCHTTPHQYYTDGPRISNLPYAGMHINHPVTVTHAIIIGDNIVVTNSYEFAFGGWNSKMPIYRVKMTPEEANVMYGLLQRAVKDK